MEVRPLRRAHPPLQETHGSQALQVPPLRPLLLPVRPLGTPHEKAPVRTASPLFTSYDLRGAPWITTDKKCSDGIHPSVMRTSKPGLSIRKIQIIVATNYDVDDKYLGQDRCTWKFSHPRSSGHYHRAVATWRLHLNRHERKEQVNDPYRSVGLLT
ncbi:hypothetical protein Pcinc_035519 [Petrolisthes cinctipes]|uniref:Uncharacterized protein n=1 Tax=Petrolisthes cinctipes TaxID=88211 RepID=A0AAE1BWF8_PETCI|nr:hypothetical protein Pcinc_035519 [Petrolisthes cinctipes]